MDLLYNIRLDTLWALPRRSTFRPNQPSSGSRAHPDEGRLGRNVDRRGSAHSVSNLILYYIEWAYQRSRLCHKCDVSTGSICKPGYKCDVNLQPSLYNGSHQNGCGLRSIMIFMTGRNTYFPLRVSSLMNIIIERNPQPVRDLPVYKNE